MEAAHLLILVALAYMVLLGQALSRPRNAATSYFMLTLLISGIWVVTYYIELTTPAIEGKIAARLFRNACLTWLPLSVLLMTCHLFGLARWLPRRFWTVICVMNATWSVLMVTATSNSLIMYDFVVREFGHMGVLTYTRGPLDALYHHGQHALAVLPLLLILPAAFRATGLRRQNLVLVWLGTAIPLAMNILFYEGFTVVPYLNIAPFSMVISIAAFSWVVLRNRALDIVPLAREMLLDRLPDLVLVTDAAGRIVDFNDAFSRALGDSLAAWKDQPARAFPPPWRDVIERPDDLREVTIDGQSRWWELSRRDIEDDDGNRVGALHVLRDVTLRVDMDRMRAESQLVAQQTRLLRDMHDGLGGIAANIGLQASLGLEETDVAEKNAVFERIEALALEGNAEIRSLMNALERREYLWTDWLNEVSKYGDTICDGRRIAWTCRVAGSPPDGTLSLLSAISLFRMIKEALHNAVRHGGAKRVELHIVFSPSEMCVTIRDDGAGFDSAKIRPGRGLTNMRKRAEELDGDMNLVSSDGTECTFRIPVPIKYLNAGMAMPETPQ